MNKTFLKSNQWCIDYDFFVGQQILKYGNTMKGKVVTKTSGPFEMAHIHVNSIIANHLRSCVTEQISVCYTIPQKDPLL